MLILKILKEYIRRMFRNYKVYTVSILGMSIAIIASFHIYHFVYKELSVNSFHTKKKEIYRVTTKWGNSNYKMDISPNPLGRLLKEKIPEVKDYTRLEHKEPVELHFKGTSNLRQFAYADPSFFELFNFAIIEGSLEKFKETPNGIFLTQKIAKELFNNKNPIGELLTVSTYESKDKRAVEVVGIIENFVETSTIQAEAIINFKVYEKGNVNEWGIWSPSLYLYAPSLADTKLLATKISDELFEERNRVAKGYKITEKTPFYLQRLDTVYFNSNDVQDQVKKGSLQFIKVISFVGILVLIFGGLNYIIMNIGLNSSRIKEFRTKRCLGASKNTILLQLILESVLNVFIAVIIAFATFPLLNTYISELIGFDYVLSLSTDTVILLTFFCLILVIGLFMGFIEFLLSYSTIVLIINTNLKNTFNYLNKYIIGFQLVLSMATIIAVLAIQKQIGYIQSKDIGFDVDNIISVPTLGSSDEIKNLLESKSYVKLVARGQTLFRNDFQLSTTKLLEQEKEIEAMVLQGDNNYLKTHKIELLLGKNLNPSLLSTNVEDHFSGQRRKKRRDNNSMIEVLVNETFVKKANLKHPTGTIITNHNFPFPSEKAVIIGVFKDVYNTPLYYPVQPTIFGFDFTGYPNIFQVLYNPEYKNELKNELKNYFKSKGVQDEALLERYIRTYNYKDTYKKELQLKRLLEAFTVIILIISVLGMIAISLFITESKTKEIGIRKVNGATINEIMLMLNKNFVKWILVAFVLACPIAYYAMSKWLENFAYKTSLSWWVFALAGLFTMVIALLTVSWQSYKAATTNPIKSLRTE
tara:strand:- start:7816 stop:10251 length:2436 start_codon:yes stop_codon:yes gene_type:complete